MGIRYGNLNTGYLTHFGTNWNNDSNSGTFNLQANNSTSNSNSNLTSRVSLYVLYEIYLKILCPASLAKY